MICVLVDFQSILISVINNISCLNENLQEFPILNYKIIYDKVYRINAKDLWVWSKAACCD